MKGEITNKTISVLHEIEIKIACRLSRKVGLISIRAHEQMG